MARKKKQHYIPKLYMRQFTNEKKRLSIINVKDMTLINNVYYEDQCYENYFYGDDLEWEDKLDKLETEWGRVFSKISKNDCITLDEFEILKMKEFTLYQLLRTVANNNFEQNSENGFINSLANMIAVNNNLSLSEDEVRKYASNYYTKIQPKDSLEAIDDLIKEIEDLSYIIISYKTDRELIFSDSPVILINQFDIHKVGLGVMGTVAFFPLSKNKLFVIYDDIMYPQNKQQKYQERTDEKEVKILNVYQFLNSEKLVLAHREKELQELLDDKELSAIRKDNRKDDGLSELGPDDRKLLIFSPRKTYYSCVLSFCKLPKYVERIPRDYREAGPRYFSKGWEEKYLFKCDLLPQLINKEKGNIISPKKIKKGCKEMYEFAKYYWKMKDKNIKE